MRKRRLISLILQKNKWNPESDATTKKRRGQFTDNVCVYIYVLCKYMLRRDGGVVEEKEFGETN